VYLFKLYLKLLHTYTIQQVATTVNKINDAIEMCSDVYRASK